jgi:hypothetical protein
VNARKRKAGVFAATILGQKSQKQVLHCGTFNKFFCQGLTRPHFGPRFPPKPNHGAVGRDADAAGKMMPAPCRPDGLAAPGTARAAPEKNIFQNQNPGSTFAIPRPKRASKFLNKKLKIITL